MSTRNRATSRSSAISGRHDSNASPPPPLGDRKGLKGSKAKDGGGGGAAAAAAAAAAAGTVAHC